MSTKCVNCGASQGFLRCKHCGSIMNFLIILFAFLFLFLVYAMFLMAHYPDDNHEEDHFLVINPAEELVIIPEKDQAVDSCDDEKMNLIIQSLNIKDDWKVRVYKSGYEGVGFYGGLSRGNVQITLYKGKTLQIKYGSTLSWPNTRKCSKGIYDASVRHVERAERKLEFDFIDELFNERLGED